MSRIIFTENVFFFIKYLKLIAQVPKTIVKTAKVFTCPIKVNHQEKPSDLYEVPSVEQRSMTECTAIKLS